MKQNSMLAMILAGGRGSRLHELTNKVAKPAVGYGGKYRIVDFPLSNCANSGIDVVGVLTQYESVLLNSYVAAGGRWGLDAKDSGVYVLPPREKADAGLDVYRGTADAISQNIDFIDSQNPEYLLILSGDIDPKTNHCIDTGQADSKFGISYEEVLEHAKEIRALKHINIIGLHLHIGSQIRELHVFENMCNKVNVIVENLEKLGCSFRFVDVGGGLGVNYDVPENEPIPNFASLFSIVHNHLSVGDREVHFEFGRSIVAECGELITKVLFNKTTATGRKLVIVDASMTELIRPALYGSYHNIENITSEDEARDKYTIVGTACESTDVFDENVTLRKTRRGDLLTIKSAGAYGMSMASRYNLHDLPGAVYSDEIQ